MKKQLKSLAKKSAFGATLMTTSALALAQESGGEAAINAAVDSGMSMVGIAVTGVIGIAALVMGIGIILRLIGR